MFNFFLSLIKNKRSTKSSWKANSVYSNSHCINKINTQATRCQNYPLYLSAH